MIKPAVHGWFLVMKAWYTSGSSQTQWFQWDEKFPWKFPLTAWPHPEACWMGHELLIFHEVWQGGHSTTLPVFERRFENEQMSVSENRVYIYIYRVYPSFLAICARIIMMKQWLEWGILTNTSQNSPSWAWYSTTWQLCHWIFAG